MPRMPRMPRMHADPSLTRATPLTTRTGGEGFVLFEEQIRSDSPHPRPASSLIHPRRSPHRTIAIPHGRAPTGMVATTFSVAASITETSFERPLAV